MNVCTRRHALALAGGSAAAWAAGWPGPVAAADALMPLLKVFFGYPTAGVGGLVSLGVGERLVGRYAKSFIVESKPGAAGRLVVDAVKRAPTDGSAVYVTPSSVLAMYPHVYAKLNYDPLTDFAPIGNICEFVHGLAVGPAVPESVKTVNDFVAWCKAHPSQANIGNPGQGSLPHLLTLLLSRATGMKFESIAYAGGPPGVTDTIGGSLTAMMATEGQFITFLGDGKLRLLATSGTRRSRFSPNVPTFAEQGIQNIQISEWIGMFAPAGTPAAVTERIALALRDALAQPDIGASFAKFAIQAAPTTPDELRRRLKADFDYWGPVIKSTGFTPLA